MRDTIKGPVTTFMLLSLGLFLEVGMKSTAAPGSIGIPKTSQHAMFKPENFERLAVIVKPMQAQQQGFSGFNNGLGKPHHDQTQMERLVEQRFLRVLLGEGYTLVSRTDLDAAMKEKGLDEANMTDDKLTQEAGKLLHVSAILVVSVDDFKMTTMQRQVARQNTGTFSIGGTQSVPYYQVVASVGARLVKIDDNMVMWTGDLSLNQAYNSQDADGIVLSSMAETIASSFPRLMPVSPKTN